VQRGAEVDVNEHGLRH